MSTALRSALVSLGLLACHGAQHVGPHSKLVLDGAPVAAAVLVDEQPVGSLAVVRERGIALPPGQHRLTVQADGYFPADLLIEVDKSGGVIKRTVRLVAVPEP